MSDARKPRGQATRLVHDDYVAPTPFGGLNVGVHHASTITWPTVAEMRARDWKHDTGYSYGLHGTPTTYTLAHRIAALEGGTHCLLVPSGLAAIVLVDLALLQAGDRLLLPDNVYNPSRDLGQSLLAGYGIETAFYDPVDPASLEALIDARTKLIWLETPGSVTMELPDIPALVAIAKRHGVLTAIDNTWAAGLLFRPFDHGVDIVMHALTKYPSGGSDVLMGSVTTRDDDLHQRLKAVEMKMGYGIGGDDAYLMLRGLATMQMRLEAAAARTASRWRDGFRRDRRSRRCCTRRSPSAPATRSGSATSVAACRAVLGDRRRSHPRSTGRRDDRCARPVRHRLQLGRRAQPRGAVSRRRAGRHRPRRIALAASRRAGALLCRDRRRGRPARRSRTGLRAPGCLIL